MKKNLLALGALALFSLGLAACNDTVYVPVPGCTSNCGGGYTPGPGGGGFSAWYDVYGGQCQNSTPKPGCNFYSDGTKITDVSDPYFYNRYVEWGIWDYTNSYGYRESYTGYAWLSQSGILYTEFGRALNEEGADDDSKDLIGDVAAAQEQVVVAAGKEFAARHALADEAGIKIARALNDWAAMGKKHTRTDQDIADFTKRLYGISLDQAKTAIDEAQAGSLAGLDAANAQIAAHWGTSPEASREILKAWFAAKE